MLTVAVVDYGVGNIGSICRAITVCGAKPLVSNNESDFKIADACILPGVGAFGDAISLLQAHDLHTIMEDHLIAYDIPILGVCLGMQLLATTGLENGIHNGLNWIPGTVKKLSPLHNERIPHVGWNNVQHNEECPLFSDIPSDEDFYFVHSYHFAADNSQNVIATTPYCGGFVSVVNHGNIFGTQFHPEKSQGIGLKLLKNFITFSEEF